MQTEIPPHPGTLVREKLGKHSFALARLARHLHVSRSAVSRLVNGKARLSTLMALQLQEALEIPAVVSLGMQNERTLWFVRQKHRPVIERLPERPVRSA